MGQDHIDLVMIISALLIFAGVFVVSFQKKNNSVPETFNLNASSHLNLMTIANLLYVLL